MRYRVFKLKWYFDNWCDESDVKVLLLIVEKFGWMIIKKK